MKKNILLGVTGGIAIYKIPGLVSLLRKKDYNVKVVMTEAATEFVTPLTFQTMSNNVVHVEMFNQLSNMDVEHISLAKWADLMVIAPATANTIAKIVNGIADNMLTTVALAYSKPMLIVPGMNTNMLNAEVTLKNMEILRERGNRVTGTQVDLLACGDIGAGKMLEATDIFKHIEEMLTPKDLIGRHFIVTAGPTQESLDPVRYITNHSSGKMGYAIAEAAKYRGAEVTLISGPSALVPPNVDRFIPVKSTEDMYNAIEKHFESADALIKAAAPADFTPKSYSENKIKKTGEDSMTVEFKKTKDMAKHFGSIKKDSQVLVGFAAESTNMEEFALGKLKKKNMDFIVANNITQEGAGFKSDTNIAKIIFADGRVEDVGMMKKSQLANIIVSNIKDILG